ncbi:MAG: sigma 54-interacting transcriptional regulator, partial [Planctomycetota bacterium]
KQAEEALRESEARFKAVFDKATDGIVVADIEERRFQVANKRFCEMLGCEPEDVTGLGVADIHREEDMPHVTQQFEKQLRGEITLARDIPVRRMDGTVFYADINASPVILAGRAYLMGIFRDVTERRRTDEALRESEELHRTLMNALPDSVTMSDLEGRITYASQRTLEVHGYDDTGDLVGESAFELIAPEDRERAIANLQKTLKDGSAKDLEYTLLRKDGSRFPAELSAAVVPDAHGAPKAFVAITHDITERRRKERELRAVEGRREELALEVAALRSEMQGRYGPESIIGRDPKMHAIYETILAVSRTNATVLVQGETGTGKELVAKAVHYNSSRREKPFVKVDCGALAENLLESELFGHVKGAFTGAVRDRAGRFELAADATIFLDEIHNLSMPLQAKLLRVVQEGRFEKVGGTKTIEVDVRIVAATNEDLESLVAQGGFRKDLYYRVNVIPIKLPPLRDRRADISLLVSAFVNRFAERHEKQATGISREALEKLTAYDWPGNVRELENIVEQAVVFSAGRTIQADDVRLPEASPSREGGTPLDGRPPSLRKALEDPEKQALLDALGRTGGNKKRAAELLGISRSALYEKLKRHGIATKR